ncbi:Sau3AI family type II restriction endonuclease [Mycoplasma corogypsi]|uniref:Sau3AI family type II restriction endonuclease n=1 Tax=Mycoplasma corogypsi TaxID=2106 RepID=UPI0038738258
MIIKKIVEKVMTGNAHKISEGDTKYLGACTKGQTADKSLQPQYYNDLVPAKRRAFSLKQSYMTYILNNYTHEGLLNYDSIFSESELKNGNFDDKVLEKINSNIGKTEHELYTEFSIDTNTNSKQINRTLTNRMLGIKTNNAEEFEKANIKIKTIRVQKNGKPKESMSFPKIIIKEFVKQEFENSFEYDFFESTRFLFVVFKENDNGDYVLRGAKFWNMPIDELEMIGKVEWESYKQKFLTGVNFEVKQQKTGKIIVSNDLPKKSDNEIFHLRPHSKKSAYLINGIWYGEGNETDMDTLPNGDKMTHQCFWLNNDYISKIIDDI